MAVLDATNSTEERRNFLRTRFHGGCCSRLAGWAAAGCLARDRLRHVLHAVCGRLGFGSQGFGPCAAAVSCHTAAGKWQYLFIESICNDMEVGLSGLLGCPDDRAPGTAWHSRRPCSGRLGRQACLAPAARLPR